jgi:hypothetical protein
MLIVYLKDSYINQQHKEEVLNIKVENDINYLYLLKNIYYYKYK